MTYMCIGSPEARGQPQVWMSSPPETELRGRGHDDMLPLWLLLYAITCVQSVDENA